MYPNAICKTQDKPIEIYGKNIENYIVGHGSCANKTRRFYAPFSVENLINNNVTSNSARKLTKRSCMNGNY